MLLHVICVFSSESEWKTKSWHSNKYKKSMEMWSSLMKGVDLMEPFKWLKVDCDPEDK